MDSSKHLLLRQDDSLFVIIDMQERLIPVVSEKETIIKNVITLIKFARIIGLPVVLTEQKNLGSTLPEITKHVKGTPPISKITFNCFGSAEFTEHLIKRRRKSLILAGIETHICVAQTALHALSDYTVHVVSDAVGSRAIHNRETALSRMQQHGAIITSTEMVIYELLEKAGTSTFKKTLELVK